MDLLDEASWVAIGFLMFGLVLIVVEVLAPGFFIAVPGGTLAFMGAIGLVAPELMYNSRWSWLLWPLAAVASTGVNLYVYKRWAPPGKAPLTMGVDSLPGQEGKVTAEVRAGDLTGKVLIKGATWSARTEDGDAPIGIGAKVRVVRAEGVHVIVQPW